MDAQAIVSELALKARTASRTLSIATSAERKAALEAIAQAIESRSAEIIAANEIDMANARKDQMHPQMQDRLLLTPERIASIAGGARQVAALLGPHGVPLP